MVNVIGMKKEINFLSKIVKSFLFATDTVDQYARDTVTNAFLNFVLDCRDTKVLFNNFFSLFRG